MPTAPGPGGSKFGPGGFENPRVGGQAIGGGTKQQQNQKQPQVQGNPSSPCLISWPSTSLPLVGSVGGGCIVSKTNVRAWVGGTLLVLSALGGVLAAGAVIAVGLKKSGALGKAADIASLVPGGGMVASGALRAAQGGTRGVSQHVTRRRSERAAGERKLERQAGEPRENRNLRTGKGAVRETPAGTRQRKREAANDTPPF